MGISIRDELLVNLESNERDALIDAVTSLVNELVFNTSVLTRADELVTWKEAPTQGMTTWLQLALNRVHQAAHFFKQEKLQTLSLVNDCDEQDRSALVETMSRMDGHCADSEALAVAIAEVTSRYAELEVPPARLWRTHALAPSKAPPYRHNELPSADLSLEVCLEALPKWGSVTTAEGAEPSTLSAAFDAFHAKQRAMGLRAIQRLEVLKAMQSTVDRSQAGLAKARTASSLSRLATDRALLKTALDEGRLVVIDALEGNAALLEAITEALFTAIETLAKGCLVQSIREAAWGDLADLRPLIHARLQSQIRALRWAALLHAARLSKGHEEVSARLLSRLAGKDEASLESLTETYLAPLRRTKAESNRELTDDQRELAQVATQTLPGRIIESQCPACDPKGHARGKPEYVAGMLCPNCEGTHLVWRLVLEGPPRKTEWLNQKSVLEVARTEATLRDLSRQADSVGYRDLQPESVGLPRVVSQATSESMLSPEAAISQWRKDLQSHETRRQRQKRGWTLLGALMLSIAFGFTFRASLPACVLPDGMTQVCVASLNPLTCAPTFQPHSLDCDDGDSGTAFDVCDGAGHCRGCPQPKAHECIVERKLDSGSCHATFKPLGTKCDDENPRTKEDTCTAAGQCVGQAFECTTSDGGRTPQCVVKAEHRDDDCALTYRPEGSACDDEKLNTNEDQCDGEGYCRGTTYSCEAQECQAESVHNGVDCTITPEDKGTPCGETRANGETIVTFCDGSREGRCNQIETCDGADYVLAKALLDDQCDERLNCSKYPLEETLCNRQCPADSMMGCDNQCYPSRWSADGECDAFFACHEAGWDGGDCPR